MKSRLKPALPFAALALVVLSGCMTPSINDSVRMGPYHTPRNHAGEARLPANLRRIVLLPIAAGTVATGESAAALTPVFIAELQKQNRFEIVTLTREECLQRFRAAEFLSTTALPHDFMAQLRRDFAADGVMFIDLTALKTYRPLIIGLRAKLATVEDVRIVWTFDNVFSAEDGAVANSARRHFLDADRGGIPADLTQSALQSPSRFATYAAAEMFATLPPLHTPPPAPAQTGEAVANPR